jgi:hypothetical protein
MKTTYKVVGGRGFAGFKPGDTFEADLDPGQERRALERGSIKKVKQPAKNEEVNGDAETDRA